MEDSPALRGPLPSAMQFLQRPCPGGSLCAQRGLSGTGGPPPQHSLLLLPRPSFRRATRKSQDAGEGWTRGQVACLPSRREPSGKRALLESVVARGSVLRALCPAASLLARTACPKAWPEPTSCVPLPSGETLPLRPTECLNCTRATGGDPLRSSAPQHGSCYRSPCSSLGTAGLPVPSAPHPVPRAEPSSAPAEPGQDLRQVTVRGPADSAGRLAPQCTRAWPGLLPAGCA